MASPTFCLGDGISAPRSTIRMRISGSASSSWRASVKPASPAPAIRTSTSRKLFSSISLLPSLHALNSLRCGPSTTAQAWPSALSAVSRARRTATRRVPAAAPVRGKPSSVASRPRIPGRHPVPEGAEQGHGLEAAGGAERLAEHGLDGGDRQARRAARPGPRRSPRPRRGRRPRCRWPRALTASRSAGTDPGVVESDADGPRHRRAAPSSVSRGSKAEPWPSTSASTRAPRAAAAVGLLEHQQGRALGEGEAAPAGVERQRGRTSARAGRRADGRGRTRSRAPRRRRRAARRRGRRGSGRRR